MVLSRYFKNTKKRKGKKEKRKTINGNKRKYIIYVGENRGCEAGGKQRLYSYLLLHLLLPQHNLIPFSHK